MSVHLQARRPFSGLGLTLVLLPLVDIREIIDTGIVEVLAGENDAVDVTGVSIRNRVSVGVPTTVAYQTQSASILTIAI